MDETNSKRKREDVSSTSSLDTSHDISTNKENENKNKSLTKSQRKKKTKLEKKELELNLNMQSQAKDKQKSEKTKDSAKQTEPIKKSKASSVTADMELHIAQINKKLSKVLTKEDQPFLKNIIKETILELKENILASVTNRIEKLEGEFHVIALENENLKTEVVSLKAALNKKTEDIKSVTKQLKTKSKMRISKWQKQSTTMNSTVAETISEFIICLMTQKTKLPFKPLSKFLT